MSNPLTSFIFNAILIISANSMAMNSFTVSTLPSERKPFAARFSGNALPDAGWEPRANRGVYPALQDSRGRPFRSAIWVVPRRILRPIRGAKFFILSETIGKE